MPQSLGHCTCALGGCLVRLFPMTTNFSGRAHSLRAVDSRAWPVVAINVIAPAATVRHARDHALA
ncbi:hypothetical protein QTH91_06730 [Variovorax dokdonensis]|uniref:Uncharacterized protein n=1 Tax=Variovorax dokdonensis TaxID=344883 RepID=A0ABT7N8A9_9BURK|nr:hypothetical protein [Variovorax dokdonensis]MDM0044171.1 hypothetical protein [Variovorax dokdonensis]